MGAGRQARASSGAARQERLKGADNSISLGIVVLGCVLKEGWMGDADWLTAEYLKELASKNTEIERLCVVVLADVRSLVYDLPRTATTATADRIDQIVTATLGNE